MALAYYGVKLSDNWIETPEGYVIFKNAVIGRTGFQKYKGFELDKSELQQQGISINPDDEVELYRSPEEVFSPKTIASFETKSITDGHPDQLINLDTVKQHEEGQITNVRKGSEPLESGDLPMIADLVVKSRNLIEKIKAGLRELSCGYNYHVLKQGGLLLQVDIIGNHVAIVNVGRAGPEASIKDSITEKGAFNMSAFLDQILGRTTNKAKIALWAKDAKPEEIATAMDALVEAVEKKEDKSKGEDAKHGAGCDCADCKGSGKDSMNDAKAKDRKRFHDALDRHLDAKEEEEGALDADMEELKTMFGGKGGGKDETVAGEETGAEMSEDGGIDEAVEALTIEPGDRSKSSGAGTDAAAAYRAGAIAVLKALKPAIANSGNKGAIGAFDTAVKTVQGSHVGTASKGGYGAVAKAAASVGHDAVQQKTMAENAAKAISEAEAANKARFNSRN